MAAIPIHQRYSMARLASALLLLWIAACWSAASRADGDFVITPPAQTGAYQAEFVEDRGHVSVIDFSGNYDENLPGGGLNSEARAVVAREFYRTHADEYDFLVVFSAFEFDTGEALAFHLGVQNSVAGIGVPIFDNSAAFGSDGKLQGYIDMAALTRYEVDPLNPNFETILSILSHELLHQWAARVRFKNPDGSLNEDLLGRDGAHWSFLLDSNASVEYGAKWRDNGDGTFTATAVRKFFSPLDLYLMGVYRAAEVPPFTLIENPDIDKTQLPRENATIEGAPRQVTIEDIIAAEGERVPAVDEAQKEFRIGFILLKGATQQIPGYYHVALDNIRQAYSQRFAIATAGRALVHVYPQAVYAYDTGAPTELSGGAARSGPSIEDGLTWLRSRQHPDGYWDDKDSTRLRDTTYALDTLLRFDAKFTNPAKAIEWLNAHQATNTDFLARQIALFGDNPALGTLGRLLALQNSDGGWGLAAGYESDALDTALAILALRKAAASPLAIERAIRFLLQNQNADGGWGNAIDAESRSGITATVLQATKSTLSAAAAVEDALALLRLRQNSDGGFGDSSSTIYDTSLVLQTFMDFDRVDQIQAAASANYLFNLQADDGSWGGSTYATALAIAALKRFNFANWQLSPHLTIDPAVPSDGDRVRLVITITNDSSLFTPQASLVIYDGDPLAGGVHIGEAIDIPVMAPGSTVTLTYYWDSFDQAGEHELYAVVDPDGLFTELSESDNQGSTSVTVQPAADGIDLAVVATDLAVLPARPNALPSTLGIVASIRNSGLLDAAQVRVVLYKESAGSVAGIVDEAMVNVPNRSSIVVNFSDVLGAAGETVYSVVIDPDNSIAEVNETNNQAQVSVVTDASVDLEITAADILSDVDPAIFGEAVNFQVRIRNRGTRETPTTQVRYVVSNGTESRLLASNNLQLAAAQTITQTIGWQVDLMGTLQVSAEVDFAGLVTELDETNNLATISLPVESRNGANLVVSYRDLGFSPGVADEGGLVNLAAAVLNNGNLAAGSFDVAFYLGDPDAGGTQIGSRQRVDGLAAGERAFVALDWQPVPSAGDKLIYVLADVDDSVPEAQDEDNRAFNVLPVSSLPDLAVSASDIGIEPAFPSANSEVTIAVNVANLGDQSARDILVRVYHGAPGGGGQLAGEQTIPVLAGKASATQSFTVALGPDLNGHSIVVQLDPHGEILERDRSNNSARKDITVQRGDIYASNLYLSPNADGVQDSTEVSFLLEQAMDVVLQVVDARDRVIREFSEQLTDITRGSVVWDGLDRKGRLVPDGDYRLRLSKIGGSHLAEVLVHVDTNRSSLLLAINSEFEFFSNLTCELDTIYAINVLDSEEQLVVEAGDKDIFSLNINGSEARPIVPGDWFENTYPYYTQTSKDGSIVAFTRDDPARPYYLDSPVWLSDGDGENLRELRAAVEDGWVLRDDGQKIYLREYESSVYSVDVQTGVEQHLYEADYSIEIEQNSFKPQPDGGKLLLIDAAYEDSGPAVILVDADDTDFEPVVLAYNWRNYRNPPSYQWSADGSKIAVTSYADGTVSVFDDKGQLLAEFHSPAGPSNATFGDPAWSSTAAEVAVSIRGEGSNTQDSSGIYVLDLDDNSMRKVASFAAGESGGELASYHVATWDGSDWVERGELHYRRFYREQQLDLSAYLPDADGDYKVRIRQTGKEAAHVESVALLSGKRRAIPSSVIKLDKSLVAELIGLVADTPRGEDVRASVSHNDYEVLDLFESEMQVEWHGLARAGQVILALNAREEALSKLNTLPFTYAGVDEGGYPYRIAANAAIQVDGALNASDGLGAPLFKHFSRPGTGHPSATVNGYVGSDNEFLYGALDFTVDNTQDGDLDWAALRVMTAQGWKDFRVTVKDGRYGMVNFTRTPAVAFAHKYYEFRIPLAELAKQPGDDVIVSFQGYGTAAIVVDENDALPLDGRLLWPAGDRTLFYDAYGEGKWAIDLNGNNRIKEVFVDWPGDSGDLIDPFFLDSGRKLLFLSDRATNDPASICYQHGTDLWSYESLLNLVVDLRATRSNSAGGIILSGTVADLNFERYTLEYASQAAPDNWSPIFTGAATQVVDSRITTWAPPAVDKYLLRLAAYDRAGNSRSVVRRASWGLNSSITDLALAPEYISPNGDGVQDEASLHYRVLEPVHLDFSVSNAQGDVVRSFSRDHGLIGTEHDLTWDGRNNLGLPVADGRYRIAVLGFEFFVNVDSTAPAIVSLATQNARQTKIINREAQVVSAPELGWSIVEANQYRIEIETGNGALPELWRPFAQPIVRDNDPSSGDSDEDDLGLTLAQFVDRAFRMRVTDVAGNVTTLSIAPGAQELVLTGLVSEEFEALTERVYRVDETLAAPIALAFIEYREQGGSGAWLEAAIETASIAEESFSFSWLPPDAGFGKRFAMRIKAIDSNAQVFYSNEKQLSFAGVLLQGLNRFTSALAQSATLNGLDAEGRFVLAAAASSNQQIVIESLRIELKSSTDPRYAAPFELLRIDEEFDLPSGTTWSISYQAPNLSGCQKYRTTAYIDYRVTDTTSATLAVRQFSGELQSRDEKDRLGEVELPCLSISASAVYAPAASCSAQTDNNVELTLVPNAGNEFGLKLLTLYTRDASGARNVFFNVNKPESGKTYRYQVDAGNHVEGVLKYYAELVNDADQVRTEAFPALIDRTAPSALIRYPQEGQLVCAIPRQLPGGDFENVVKVDVDVDDPIGNRSNDDPLTPFRDELAVEMQFSRNASTVRTDLPLGDNLALRLLSEHGVEGNLTELVNVNGDYSLHLQATDLAGNQQCLLRRFSVDGSVEHEALRADYTLFSPNDDGVLDSVEISVGVGEPVSLDVSVYATRVDARGKVVISGDAIGHVANQLQLLPGSEFLSWDGRNAGGQVVDDGDYLLVFDYRDACGNRAQRQMVTTVDHTAPTAIINYPRAGDPLTSILEVLASVDDVHLKQYTLELGQGTDPETWVALAADTRAIASKVIAVWNTVDLTGAYTLRLTATDRAGNVSTALSNLLLLERSSLISYFEALPLLISPNQDNRREAASIRLGLESAALVTLDILDGNDIAVRSLAQERAFNAGAVNLSWDGQNDAGATVADGTYRVALGVVQAANPLVKQTEALTLVVDSSAPQIAITQPQGFANGAAGIIGSISDAHLQSYELSLTSTPQAPQWNSLASGDRNQAQQLLASLGELEEGDYALRVSATDEGESVSEQVIAFSVDNTPPQIAILAPAAASFIGANPESAAVVLEVADDNLEFYALNIGAGDSPATWTELISGSETPITSPALVLQASTYADGPYTLQLVASDAAGNQSSASRLLQIDNRAPLAEILLPVDGSYITGPVQINGNATDANLLAYRLDVSPATLDDASQWSEIGGGDAEVSNALLLDWFGLPPDGDYILRLSVEDRAENIASARIALTVDTTPPAPPAALDAVVDAAAAVRLGWPAGVDADIAGYRVYRDGVEISSALVAATEFRDEDLADGRYRYTVRSEDYAGWLSEPSIEVELLLDTTPPVARIFSPRDHGVASGVVALKGTANSADDFREYRVYLRQGQAADWQLLQQSPVPIVAAVLYELDTTNFAEGASFALKLEAEDIYGNVGTALVNLTVDNQAPQAPTGLIAVGNDENVSLAWNPNLEADLLGYLLFRGEQIANAVGVVIGDLQPYALPATNYNDLALADGLYAYTVAAIDHAGNLSERSLVAEILVDTRAPAAVIATPADGARFDTAQYVSAVSDATDIARVQFQYKAAVDNVWLDLGPADESEPFSASLDPLALNFAQGAYQLRAIATDLGARVDPAPAATVVYYTDVTRPAAVRGLVAQAYGAEVELNWEAAGENDLAGYHVERIDESGTLTRLTGTLLTATTLTDTVGDDGIYDYRVFAMDSNGNLGDASNTATARVHTPLLQQPYTPLDVPGPIELVGRGVPLSTVHATLANVDGVRDLPAAVAAADGVFRLPDLDLALGENRFSLRLTDSFGHVSREVSVQVTHGLPPAPPTGLAAAVAGYDVTLSWDAGSAAGLLGYRIYRDGADLLEDYPAAIIEADASQSASSAFRAIDSSRTSYWSLAESSGLGSDPALLTLTLDRAELLTQVEVEWYRYYYGVLDYDIEARSGDAWVTLLRVRDAEGQVQSHRLDGPYYSDQLRLRLLRAYSLESDFFLPVRLADLRIEARAVLPATEYVDTTLDGHFDYAVSAVSKLGFEGARSAELQVGVGDITAPAEVLLTATVSGSDVQLGWLASASSDVSRYELFRDGALLAEFGAGDLSHRDRDLANGSYAYVVYAIDALEQRSLASNLVEVAVAVGPLPAPEFVSVTAAEEGASLDLLWQALDNGVAHAYRVLRALEPGGPYTAVADVAATRWRDLDLVNGAAYYYRIAALDAAANEGLPSRELSAVPLDQIVPVTVLLAPGAGDLPQVVDAPAVDIFGQSEARAAIQLLHDGIPAAATVSSNLAESTAYPVDAGRLAGSLSPDGRSLVQVLATSSVFTDLSDGSTQLFYTTVNHDRYAFAGDGSGAAYARPLTFGGIVRNTVYRRTPAGHVGMLTNPFGGDDFDYPALSADGSRFAALGVHAGGARGLWVKSLAANDWALLRQSDVIAGDSLQWSPDDRYLAYRVADIPGIYHTLEVVDLDSGNIVVVDDRAQAQSGLHWSVDGHRLLYGRVEGSASNLWRYNTDSGLAEALTAGADNDFSDPHEFIGPAKLLAVSAGAELVLIDLDRQRVDTLLETGGIGRGSLHRAQTGDYAFIDQDRAELVRFTPAGRFSFAGVALRLGDNRFSATATDDAGQSAPALNALAITYDVSDRPDLVVDADAMSFVPAVMLAGSAATIQVVVANRGGAAAADATLTLVATDATGFSQVLLGNAPLAYLEPGATTALSARWTPALAGAYRVLAIVDPDGRVDEADEANNRVSLMVPVLATAGPLLNLSTDQAFYGAQQDVSASLELFNGGSAFSGYLEVLVEDALGFSVERITGKQPVELAYGARLRSQFSWNTGTTFAGAYRVHAYLYSSDQLLIADQLAAFDLGETRGLSSTVFSDRASYPGNSDVLVSASVNYSAGNALFDAAVAHLQIVNADAVIVAQQDFALGTLLPGASQNVNLRWNTSLSGPGAYALQFDVTRDQQLVTQASGGFDVRAGSTTLEAELSVQDDSPAVGEAQTARFELTNVNNLALDQLALRVQLIDPGAQRVLESQLTTVDIAPGASVAGSAVFATEGLQLKTYSLLLQAFVDAAAGAAWINLASADFALRDRSAPVLQVLRPQAGAYLRGDAGIQVSVADDLSFIDRVEVSIDGEAWQAMALADAGRGEYGFALAGFAEGTHSLQARARDAWGNSAQSGPVSFIVDNTAPVIEVSGVDNAGIYNSAVTPMVVIGEAYPGAFYITQSGLPFVVGEVFASDGIYQLEIYATDLAGNQAQQVVQFTIDQQAPAIEISGLVDGAAYNTLVAPVIQISDANLHSQQVRLNGQTYLSATPIAAEGDYVLEAIGIDIAGNTTRVEYRFSIDFSAPSIAISGVADQAHYNRDVIALVDVSDAGQYTASITLNGQAYVPGEPISAPGDYQLVVTASDAAGNAAGATLAFVIDRTAPVIDIGGVVDNGFYKAAAPAISVSETHLDSLGITLDGVDYVSQTPVSAEGGHLLRVAARDRAGNESIREVFFTVDFTAPLVSVDTPLHGETLFTRNTDVVGQTEPFATVHLQLGQARLVTQADVGGLFAFNGVVLEQGANTLLLNATDRAANAGPLTEISVQVVSGDVPGEYRAPGGILIWSAHRQDDCTSVKSKKSVKSTKSVTALKDGKPDCHVHQPGEMLQHAGEPGLALLQQALAAERRDYLLVHNEYDFLRAMRSQRFGTLLLLDWHKDYCGKYDNSCATDGFELDELKVGRDTRDEIRALVASGSGLLWIKTRPEQEDDWTGLAGVRARAALNGVSTIEVLDSPIATAGEFDYAGRAVTLDLDGATALGVAQPRGKTVLSANDYGAGRVVVLAFNPAAAVDAERAARLLAELVAYVTPVTTNLTVNGVAEVDWVIEDVPAATAIELRVNLPAGLRFLHAADATLNESRDEALWQRDYAAADNRFSALVRLAAAAGSYDIDAALAQVDGEQRLVLGTGQLSLAIDDRFAEYRAQLLASVAAIEVSKKGKSSKHDKYAIRKILDLLDEAFAHEPASAALADIESAIDALLEVAYEVEKKALNTRPLTRQLGDVLRVYQSAWYRLVVGGEVGDEL